LNLGGVWLKASFAFVVVGFGVSHNDGADLKSACGRCDEADYPGPQQLTSLHCCLVPLAHQKVSLVSRRRGQHKT